MLVDGFLDRAKEEFGFGIAILLTDSQYVSRLYDKFHNEGVIIIPISDPLYGTLDYIPTVRRLIREVLLFCPDPETIIVNSSGGTEKMTNIIKDSGDILSLKYPVRRVFGIYDVVSKDVIFTTKPELDKESELDSAIIEASSTMEEINGIADMDFD